MSHLYSHSFKQRLRFLYVSTLIGFSVVGVRLCALQLFQSQELSQIAQESRRKFQVHPPRRGTILDIKGHVLATTECLIEVGLDPECLDLKDQSKWMQVASLLNLNWDDVAPLFKPGLLNGKPIRWRKLAEGIDQDTYARIQALHVKGVYGNPKYTRVYPQGMLAAHVIGFVNKEDDAVMGIEQWMDPYLRGCPGWYESEKDGRRNELLQYRVRDVEARDGLTVQSSLDSFVSHVVQEALDGIVEAYDPDGASIIVSDPQSGFLYALGNYPSFNLNEYGKAPMDWQRNRAISDLYEPGSVFKIVTMGAAMAEGCVDLNEQFDCTQAVAHYGGRKFSLPKDNTPMGLMRGDLSFVKSSNRAMAHLAIRMGAEKFYAYIKRFGFGERTGFDLAGEIPGSLMHPKHWDGLTITRMPMGHAIGTTAIQVHQAMCAVAAEGRLMKPQVVARVLDEKGQTCFEFQPIERRQVLPKPVCEQLKSLLVRVASPEGTSSRAQVKGGYHVAGKSGTSQEIVNGRYVHNRHVGSFSGFLPAYEGVRPRLAITVCIKSPQVKGTAYGGLVAAPVFKEIAQKLIPYFNIEPFSDHKMLAARKDGKPSARPIKS